MGSVLLCVIYYSAFSAHTTACNQSDNCARHRSCGAVLDVPSSQGNGSCRDCSLLPLLVEGEKRGVAAGGGGVDREGALGGEAVQVRGPPAFGPVPDRPSPPNGCTPTTAPIMLRLT